MKKPTFIFLVFNLNFCLYAFPAMESIPTEQLLNASVIVEGYFDSYTNTGETVISDADAQQGKRNIICSVFKASIKVKKVINGKIQNDATVAGLFAPVDVQRDSYMLIRHQQPNTKEIYLFFLSYSKSENEYTPVSQKEFALEIEQCPDNVESSVVENLRAIAKANVDATNYTVAVRWAGFLSGLHDDYSYWTNKTQDVRILIRATSYETLVQDFPETPGLRTEVIKCLCDTIPPKDDSDVQIAHMQLIVSISKLFNKEPPKADEIKSLLGSGDKNVNETALTLIRRKKDASMGSDVVHLMTTSKDKDVQYACIKTLYVLTENPFLITYKTFLEHPDDYVKEWEITGKALAK